MTQKKPLTNEEINTVGWFCKNSEELRLFLNGKYLQNMDLKDPSPEYVVGGVFYGEYAESSVIPPKRKEVEFINNNLYWKETEFSVLPHNGREVEAIDKSLYWNEDETEDSDSDEPTLYSEIDRTMGTLECTNLQEDVRVEFLHHLSCLLSNVRKNLYDTSQNEENDDC